MKVRRLLLAMAILSGLVFPMSGQTAVTLTVTPITWNIVGLDSNKPTTGPKFFPVAARVCNTGGTASAAITATFVWDSANANVNLRAGSLNPITLAALAPSACADAYFEVEVTQVAAAYDTTRRYHITATDGSATASTPTPRELYVEHLVSQNRNGITDIKLNGVSIPAGGEMTLLVGNTYTIQLDGFTATQGYNQLESFINFPNTIFQILGVNATYSADSNTANVPNPNDRLYANACVWENDPTSPNYRSCIGGDDKAGGTVTVTYTVKIIGGGGTAQTLGTLFYDFSGSSFHYNSDFSSTARIANILTPASLTIAKSFSPSSTVPGGLSTLTFTIANPLSETITGLNFVDDLPSSPGSMVVATPATFSTSGCGSPTFAPVAGAASLSFANGTVAANSSCTVSVAVTVPASPSSGTYTNTSNNLFVDSLDTGHNATAALTLVSPDAGSGICGITLATWTFPTGFSVTAPAATVANVTASASAGAGISSPPISSTNSTTTVDGTLSWGSNGSIDDSGTTLNTANNDYFEFALDTTGQSSITLTFDALRKTPNGPQGLALFRGTSATPPGTQFSDATLSATSIGTPNQWFTFGPYTINSGLNGSGTTYFRIYAFNAGNQNPGADVNIDNVHFTGCGTAAQPTITKSFSPNPIAVNATSTLTFTLANSNTAQLSGVKFTDTLPSGVQVAATPSASTTCGNSPTWAPAAGSTSLAFGQTTGATIPASSSCTVSVNVTATTSGAHTNVSGFISSTESGTNAGAGGSATASLTALQAPSITKVFAPDPILTGGTSTLTFLVTNPNPNDSLPSVAFSDTFPTTPGAMVVAATPNPSTSGCGAPTWSPSAGAGSVAFAGGTVAAGGTCTVKVDVTVPVAGDYSNTSAAVTAVVAGTTLTGNTAADSVSARDANPGIALLKRVSTSASGPWKTFVSVPPGTSLFYQFLVENTGDVPLSPISVTDPTVSASGCTWPVSLPVASPIQDPTAACVVGPVNAVAGDNPNTATAHGTNGATVKDSLPSSADYIGAVPGFSLLKQIGTTATGPWSSFVTVAPGTNVFYKLTVVNTGNVALTGVNVTDPDVSTATCTFSDPLAVNGATTCVVGPVTGSSVLGAHPNTATAHGMNGVTPVDSAPSSATYTVASAEADLSINKTHSGNFTQGQQGTYTLTVQNVGLVSTSGTVTVTDNAPAGMTVTAMVGTGWTCTTLPTCTRSDALTPSASYPTITVTVSVSATAPSSLINVATVSNAADTNSANDSASDPTTIGPGPDLTIQKSHSGNFTQGQTGATYTVTVSNVGQGLSIGQVTVTESAPSGLTVTAMAGMGWTCTTLPTCTRSDALAGSQSYPAITVTVSVSASAPSSLTNVATVSGGGDTNGANNSASDLTTINTPVAGPDLAIQKSHSGNFVQGQTGTYTLTVTNVGGTATSGLVTVTDSAPTGLTVTAMAGTGWTCTTLPTCTRSDVLAPAASYPTITVTVSVSATAASSVTNAATVSNGGDTNGANNTASDPTTVNAPVAGPDLTIHKTHSANFVQNQTGTYTLTVTNVGGSPTSGLVTVTDTLPTGLTATAITGTGWTCILATLTCTRSDVLASGASYPVITLTVDVALGASASLINSASVSGGGDSNPANNATSDTTTIDPPASIPTLSTWTFTLLAAVLALIAFRALRCRGRAAAR